MLNDTPADTPRLPPSTLKAACLVTVLALLAGCGEDPMGPDNRLALLALSKCRYAQALQLTDNAIARGNEHNIHRGWALKAAILRDMGDDQGAEALYPRIAEAWEAAKGRTLTPARRERDIDLFLDVARAERVAMGLAEDCADLPQVPAATQPPAQGPTQAPSRN
jgi:hypothetical protein